MYKVILVDDEEWITESLKISIPWEEYGFEICATATNGEIALKKIIELHPDVIFSDIKMPCTNGLDLIAQAKKIIPDMFSVIISGYSEFEYAKTAIQHGVDGYCNKPIDEDEIIEHLKNFKFKLDMLKHRKNNLKLLDCIENNDKSMLLSLFPNNAASSFINIIVSIGGNIDVLEDKPDILYCRISTDRWVYFIQKSLESINQNKIRQILSENVKGVGIYEMNSYNDDLSVSIDKAGIRACQYFFDENQIVFSGNYNRDKIKRYNHLLNEIINQVNNKDAYALNKSFNDIKDNLKNLNIFELQKSYNILNTLKRLNIADVDVDANTDTDTNTDVDAVSVTDTDTSTDTGTGTGTYTSTDTGTGTGAYTSTDTDTGTYTGTDTDTGTDTHIDTDTDADADADALWLNQNSYLLKNWKNAEHYFTYFSLQINLLINKKMMILLSTLIMS